MPKRRLPLVAAVYLGTFVALLDVSIVNVALPAMQKALRIDFGGLQWVVDAYTLCLSAFMLSAGLIGDRYGRKRSWLAGVGIFVLGSAICAFAPNLPVLLAGRVVQGIAGALLIPGALSILTQAFPDARERAGVIGGWEEALAAEADRLRQIGDVWINDADDETERRTRAQLVAQDPRRLPAGVEDGYAPTPAIVAARHVLADDPIAPSILVKISEGGA